ncbi:MAG: hypothetical protein JSR31_11025 [Nitrospira sp.]|nr:hypothetical protein [Nitrospira sp.]
MNRARLLRGYAIVAFILGIYLPLVTPSVRGEMLPAMKLATYKVGTVDAIYTSSIRISGTDYRVQSDAKIMNHKENEITLEEVFLRSEAKFHLNKMGEIDLMVVMRPQ